LVEKKYGHALKVRPRPADMTFNEVSEDLTASFERELLYSYLPYTRGASSGDHSLAKALGTVIPEDTRKALAATEFVGVYGRVIRSTDDKDAFCLQYLYVWDYQAVPAHEGDYEPVFVYVYKKKAYVIFDFVHYCSRRLDLTKGGSRVGLQVVPGWHSFLPLDKIEENERDNITEILPLSDQHLQSWWSIPEDGPRLKIVDFLKDPYLLEAPGHFLKEPDENAQTMCCSFLQIENALKEFEDPKQGVIEGAKRALVNCVGILALYRLGAFLQLLGEMNDIGMVKVPAPLTAGGININAVLAMLRDGFIQITKTGSDIMKGLLEP
jgi:hypothetical protein